MNIYKRVENLKIDINTLKKDINYLKKCNAKNSIVVLKDKVRKKYRVKYIQSFKSEYPLLVEARIIDFDDDGNSIYDDFPKSWTPFIKFVNSKENKSYLYILEGCDYGFGPCDNYNIGLDNMKKDLDIINEQIYWDLFNDLIN